MAKLSVTDINVAGKRVLVRVDFNVPLEAGQVADTTRLRASIPTIEYLVNQGARVILMSHLGRPNGRVKEQLRMQPVAEALGGLLGRPVQTVADCIGSAVDTAVASLQPGQVLLLENLRFYPGEEANDAGFATALASMGDIYVNDAFGTAHRAHASTVGVAVYLPAVAGLLLQRELEVLDQVLAHPRRPFVAVIGGAKVSDKMGVLRNLLKRVDSLIVGGGMANTFLLAQGCSLGDSLVEPDKTLLAQELLQDAEQRGVSLLLPQDLVIAQAIAAEAPTQVRAAGDIPQGWRAVDIGPETAATFAAAIGQAGTVLWNGPMGVFEVAPFAHGTAAVAKAMASLAGVTVVGGGDSAAAVEQLGLANAMTHISTGGGATLELLEGKTLPGVAVLNDKGETL